MAELQKYEPQTFGKNITFDRGRGSPADARGDKLRRGGLSLRFTVDQLNKLLADLEKFRPDKIDKLRSRISVRV